MNAPVSIEAKPDLKKVPELTLHQLCEIIPPCTEAEFKELKEDIKRNGLQVPIKTFDAKILDGRSRYKACVELEQEGHLVEFKRESFLRTPLRHQHERQTTASVSFATCAHRGEIGDKQTWWRPVGKITD
jgi:ParB-like chromosome segregation protein Spo0J